MYRIIRYFNQNRKKILIIIFIIISALVMLNMMNQNAGENNKKLNNEIKSKNIIKENVDVVNKDFDLSGNKKSTQTLKSDKEAIDKFINFCNEGNVTKAYDMLTDECKEALYNSEEIFNKNYYSKIFEGQSKNVIVENWSGSTYLVKFQDNILASGKIEEDRVFTDYITTQKVGEDKKINISGYIKKSKINKENEYYGLNIKVNYKDVFMDYEIYNITFINSTDSKILIDELKDSNSMYIEDKAGAKYCAYSHELASDRLVIRANAQNTISIKFSNIYRSDKKIKKIVFSDIIYKYEDINYKDEMQINLL